jgi:hypothetical protein
LPPFRILCPNYPSCLASGKLLYCICAYIHLSPASGLLSLNSLLSRYRVMWTSYRLYYMHKTNSTQFLFPISTRVDITLYQQYTDVTENILYASYTHCWTSIMVSMYCKIILAWYFVTSVIPKHRFHFSVSISSFFMFSIACNTMSPHVASGFSVCECSTILLSSPSHPE